MGYRLEISEADASTLYFVGMRYAWSSVLIRLGIASEGTHEIPEHEAWQIREAFEEDTDGGHSMFPMLDSRSELYKKLTRFEQSIV